VVQLDPRREAAWRRLGYKKIGQRWAKPDLLVAEKAELEAQARANKFWKPRLEHLRDAIAGHDRAKKVTAEAALGQITDPRAVPMVWTVLARGNQTEQQAALRILGQVDAPGASRALCLLSLYSPYPEVRGASVELLRRRDPREFAWLLVDMIRDRVKYEAKPVGGPGSPGSLTILGNSADTQRRYSPPPAPVYIPAFNDTVFPDANGQPVIYHPLGHYYVAAGQARLAGEYVAKQRNTHIAGLAPGTPALAPSSEMARHLAAGDFSRDVLFHERGTEWVQLGVPYLQIPIGQMMAASEATAMLAQRQLEMDVKSIDDLNALIAETNSRALQVLAQVSGQSYGSDRQSWERWLSDLRGYAYVSPPVPADKPTLVEEAQLTVLPQPAIVSSVAAGPTLAAAIDGPIVRVETHSCFAAGTPVLTFSGPRPIEEVINLGQRPRL
jgi:hypothetical protein